MSSRPRVGVLWEQRVSTKGDSYFYGPDSHSLCRQKQIGKHGEQRVVYQRVVEDYSEPPYKQQDAGEPSSVVYVGHRQQTVRNYVVMLFVFEQCSLVSSL